MVIRDNEIRGMAGADLIVNVNLRAYNSLDYFKADTIVGIGAQAAESKAMVLAPYSVDDQSWQQYLKARKARERDTVPVPQFVKVEGTNPEASRHLEQYLAPLTGKPVDDTRINNLLTRLTAIGKFDRADYVLAHRDGQDGLVITVHEKNYAPPILQAAFAVDGSENDDVTYTLLTRLTFMDIAGYRSEWRTDVQFGNTYGASTELYRPFTAMSKWFVAPHADASSSAFKVFRKNDPQADYRLYRTHVGGDVGYGFSRFSEVRAGYEVGYLDTQLRLGTPQFASTAGRVGDTKFHFRARTPMTRSLPATVTVSRLLFNGSIPTRAQPVPSRRYKVSGCTSSPSQSRRRFLSRRKAVQRLDPDVSACRNFFSVARRG